MKMCPECQGRKLVICPNCNGSGSDDSTKRTVCKKCNGEGQVLCSACGGSGVIK